MLLAAVAGIILGTWLLIPQYDHVFPAQYCRVIVQHMLPNKERMLYAHYAHLCIRSLLRLFCSSVMHVSALQLYAANATCAAVTCNPGTVVGNSSTSINNLTIQQAKDQCCVVSHIAALLIAATHLQVDENFLFFPSIC